LFHHDAHFIIFAVALSMGDRWFGACRRTICRPPNPEAIRKNLKNPADYTGFLERPTK
jgi:hypothetical protein